MYYFNTNRRNKFWGNIHYLAKLVIYGTWLITALSCLDQQRHHATRDFSV